MFAVWVIVLLLYIRFGICGFVVMAGCITAVTLLDCAAVWWFLVAVCHGCLLFSCCLFTLVLVC